MRTRNVNIRFWCKAKYLISNRNYVYQRKMIYQTEIDSRKDWTYFPYSDFKRRSILSQGKTSNTLCSSLESILLLTKSLSFQRKSSSNGSRASPATIKAIPWTSLSLTVLLIANKNLQNRFLKGIITCPALDKWEPSSR